MNCGENKLLMYEEERVLDNQYLKTPKCIIQALEVHRELNADFYHGDIFVFQLNPYHSYFRTLQAEKYDACSLPNYIEECKRKGPRDILDDSAHAF